MTWEAWLDKCDKLAAMYAEGKMTDDFDFDWRASYERREDPTRAVMYAILRGGGVQDDFDVVW